jgi:predicted RNA-binding Zn-ribbon protein involved in translation (DUF1610 family)
MPPSDATRLKRALRQRGVSMRCPACDWTLDGPLGDYVLMPQGKDVLGSTSSAGVKLMIFACRNCGYVRLHSANVLDDASNANGA